MPANFRTGSRAFICTRTTTYAELAEQARRTASMLVRLGVRPGDRVGILLPNVPEFLSTINGIWMAGAAAVAISPLSVAEEVSALVAATGCRVAVALDVLAPLLWDGPTQPQTVVLTTLQDRLPRWQQPLYWFARQRRFFRQCPAPARPRVVVERGAARSNPDFVADANCGRSTIRRSCWRPAARRATQSGRSQPSQPGRQCDADSRLGRHHDGARFGPRRRSLFP